MSADSRKLRPVQKCYLLGQLVNLLASATVLTVWSTTQGHAQALSQPFQFHYCSSLLDLAALSVATLLRLLVSAMLVSRDCLASPTAARFAFGRRAGVLHSVIATLLSVYGVVKLALVASSGLSEVVGNAKDTTTGTCVILVLFLVGNAVEAVTGTLAMVERRRTCEQSANGDYVALASDANQERSSSKGQGSSVGRLVGRAKSEAHVFLFCTILNVLSSVCIVLIPRLFGRVIATISGVPDDRESQHDAQKKLEQIYLLFAITCAAQLLSAQARSWLLGAASERVIRKLRSDAFAVAMQQDIAFFDEKRVGDLTSCLQSDTLSLKDFMQSVLPSLLRSLIVVIGSVVYMYILSWRLALIVCACVPINALLAVRLSKILKAKKKQSQEALGQASNTATESFSCIRTVKAFTGEARLHRKYDENVDKVRELGTTVQLMSAVFTLVQVFFFYVAILGSTYYGSTLVIHKRGNFDEGDLTTFLLFTVTVIGQVMNLSFSFSTTISAVGASSRVFALLDSEPKMVDGSLTEMRDGGGAVQLNSVEFTYPSRPEEPVIKGITLSVPQGSVAALVGPSGGGKSTIMALLQRFYDPDAGNILIDGCDIRQYKVQSLRRMIAVVAQEPVIFAASIKENIEFGSPTSVGMDQVMNAARQANAHSFIDEFDQKYETYVGERGVRLSGGQKQRIAIARALLSVPKILLLDEATSALDSESEHLVQEAIAKAMEKCTVLVVAHRLATVKGADQVFVVNKGLIAQSGTHQTLMNEHEGLYASLVQKQMLSDSKEAELEEQSVQTELL